MRYLAPLVLVFMLASCAHAQATQSTPETEKATVISVVSQNIRTIPGTTTTHNYQTLSAQILSGSDKGRIVTVENDYLTLSAGDTFFLTHETGADGSDQYMVSDADRLPALGILVGLFIIAVVLVGGWTGVRGLLALAASFLFILYVLLPGILAGYEPTAVAAIVASAIIVAGSYLTHGINRTTSAAVLGMISTIVVTAGIAVVAVHATQLSGWPDCLLCGR